MKNTIIYPVLFLPFMLLFACSGAKNSSTSSGDKSKVTYQIFNETAYDFVLEFNRNEKRKGSGDIKLPASSTLGGNKNKVFFEETIKSHSDAMIPAIIPSIYSEYAYDQPVGSIINLHYRPIHDGTEITHRWIVVLESTDQWLKQQNEGERRQNNPNIKRHNEVVK